MKHTLLIITALLLIVGCSSKKTDTDFTLWYDDGNKMSEIIFTGVNEDGMIRGAETNWYENGQKESEGSVYKMIKYDEIRYDGLWTYWYENGKKDREVNYVDGHRTGFFTKWYKNGNKMEEGNYYLYSGRKGGLWTYWYENGNKEKEGNYIIYDDGWTNSFSDKKEGVWTYYREDGTVNTVLDCDKIDCDSTFYD